VGVRGHAGHNSRTVSHHGRSRIYRKSPGRLPAGDGSPPDCVRQSSLGHRRRVEHNLGRPEYRFVQADLLDRGALRAAMSAHDIVFHLGANTEIPRGTRDTRIDLDNCVMATYNALEAMRSLGIKNLVFASSSTVFGEVQFIRFRRTLGPCSRSLCMERARWLAKASSAPTRTSSRFAS